MPFLVSTHGTHGAALYCVGVETVLLDMVNQEVALQRSVPFWKGLEEMMSCEMDLSKKRLGRMAERKQLLLFRNTVRSVKRGSVDCKERVESLARSTVLAVQIWWKGWIKSYRVSCHSYGR